MKKGLAALFALCMLAALALPTFAFAGTEAHDRLQDGSCLEEPCDMLRLGHHWQD